VTRVEIKGRVAHDKSYTLTKPCYLPGIGEFAAKRFTTTDKEFRMGKFVVDSLGRGETVRYIARVSLWRFAFNFLVGGLLALIALPSLIGSLFVTGAGHSVGTVAVLLLFIAIVLLIWPFVARRSTELAITDKRLIAKYGVLSTHSIEIRFDKIETVRVSQGIIGRLFNYGDVIVTGTGSTFDPIKNIASAMRFRTALNDAMDPAALSGPVPATA
jgi:membrane protein YdbS with pleckstrin-like domain